MSSFEDLYEYPENIPPSYEVQRYEDRFAMVLNTDWRQRANIMFRAYEASGSQIERTRGLGAWATALTQEHIMREVHELEEMLAYGSAPDYINF